MNYKVERCNPENKTWEEVILSPFETKQQALKYYKKYNMYFPREHAMYRIINLKTKGDVELLQRDA